MNTMITNKRGKKNPEFTEKQKRFCEEYLKDFNGKQAAIRAGYSRKSAEVQASTMLTYAKVQEYLSKLKEEVSKAARNSAEVNIRNLIVIKDRCMQHVRPKFNTQGEQFRLKI